MRELTKYQRLMKTLTRAQRGWTQKVHRSAEDIDRLRAEVSRSRRRGRRHRPLKLGKGGLPPQKRRRLVAQRPAQAWAQEILLAARKRKAAIRAQKDRATA